MAVRGCDGFGIRHDNITVRRVVRPSWGVALRRTVLKTASWARDYFHNFIFASAFTITVIGIAVISNHTVMAAITVVCVATVKYALKNSRLEKLINTTMALFLLFLGKLLGIQPDEKVNADLKNADENKRLRLEINQLVAKLPDPFLPQSAGKLGEKELKKGNEQSYIQYNFESDGGLEIELLKKRRGVFEKTLTDAQILDTLKVLSFFYSETKTISLPKVVDFQTFIPVLQSFPQLSKLVLQETDLDGEQMKKLFNSINLSALKLKGCFYLDEGVWKQIVNKTVVFEPNQKANITISNKEEMQEKFQAALIDNIIGRTDEMKETLIAKFVETLPDPSKESYYPLACLGVDLDFELFIKHFKTHLQDQITPESMAKKFLQAFYKAHFVVEKLSSPFVLDGSFFLSVAGLPIKHLKTSEIKDFAALEFLPALEILELKFEGESAELKNLLDLCPEHIDQFMLKRSFSESGLESYLTLLRTEEGFIAKVHGADHDLQDQLDDLKKLDNIGIEIAEVDLSEIGEFKNNKDQNLNWVFNFCQRNHVKALNLANCQLKDSNLIGSDNQPGRNLNDLFASGLTSLNLSGNPDLTSEIYQNWNSSGAIKINIIIDSPEL